MHEYSPDTGFLHELQPRRYRQTETDRKGTSRARNQHLGGRGKPDTRYPPTWEREIEKAIRGATGIIVLLSPESNNSEWVRREISFGEQHRKRIFPVLIEGEDDTSTPLRLANHQHVDLRTKFEDGLDELAAATRDYIGVKEEIAT